MCLTEKNHVLVSVIQAWANNAVAFEFRVSELTIYIKEDVFKQKRT